MPIIITVAILKHILTIAITAIIVVSNTNNSNRVKIVVMAIIVVIVIVIIIMEVLCKGPRVSDARKFQAIMGPCDLLWESLFWLIRFCFCTCCGGSCMQKRDGKNEEKQEESNKEGSKAGSPRLRLPKPMRYTGPTSCQLLRIAIVTGVTLVAIGTMRTMLEIIVITCNALQLDT